MQPCLALVKDQTFPFHSATFANLCPLPGNDNPDRAFPNCKVAADQAFSARKGGRVELDRSPTKRLQLLSAYLLSQLHRQLQAKSTLKLCYTIHFILEGQDILRSIQCLQAKRSILSAAVGRTGGV